MSFVGTPGSFIFIIFFLHFSYGNIVDYTAPEVLKEQHFSTKSDVYAFGVILYEIWTQSRAYEEHLTPFQVMECVTKGSRPIIPEDCPLWYRQLMIACWDQTA